MHRLIWVFLFALLNGACAPFLYAGEDDGGFQIGSRKPEAAPQKLTQEQYLAAIQRVLKAPAPVAPNEQHEAVVALVTEARNTPELFTGLLIPPGYPNAVSKADPNVRARVATILGMTGDRRTMQALINSAVYDPDEKTRTAAGKALPKLEEPAVLRKLVDLAIAKDIRKYPWVHRRAACAAIRRYGDLYAIDRIMKELSYELAGGNVLDAKNRPRGVPSGIGTDNPLMLPDSTPVTNLAEYDLYPVLGAMKEITNAELKPGASDKDLRNWQVWWRENKPTFKFPE